MCKATVVNDQTNNDSGTHWFSIHTASVGWTTFFILFFALCAFLIFLGVWSCILRCRACRSCADCQPCNCCPSTATKEDTDVGHPTAFPMTTFPYGRVPVQQHRLHNLPVTKTPSKRLPDGVSVFPPFIPGENFRDEYAYTPDRFQDLRSATIPRGPSQMLLEPPTSQSAESDGHHPPLARRPRQNPINAILDGPTSDNPKSNGTQL